MARILLNTVQHGQIYAVQRLGLTDSDWRRRLPATKAANEQLKAQTKEYAPVIAHIWNEKIADRDLESSYLQYIEERWTQYGDKVAEIAQQGSLQLFATGNDHTQYPDNPYTSVLALLDFNDYTSLRTDLKDKVIAITGARTRYNQRVQHYQICGDAKDFCLAAESEIPVYLNSDGSSHLPAGTSTATAYASGVALAIKQKYDWFKAKDIRNAMFTTAIDRGDPGVDRIWGVGELNAEKALKGYGRFDKGNDNKLDVNGIAERYAFDNDISGDGGFTKLGSKELILNGNNTFTGKSTIKQGTVTLNGSNVADFHVEQGGTLASGTSRQSISSGSINNAGTINALNRADWQVNGDFTNQATGVINKAIGSKILVKGTATLAGAMNVTQVAEGYIPQSGHREVLFSADSLIDQGILLNLDPALLQVADTIAFNQDKKQIYVGVARKSVEDTMNDLDKPATDENNPSVDSVDTTVPPTTATETDKNPNEPVDTAEENRPEPTADSENTPKEKTDENSTALIDTTEEHHPEPAANSEDISKEKTDENSTALIDTTEEHRPEPAANSEDTSKEKTDENSTALIDTAEENRPEPAADLENTLKEKTDENSTALIDTAEENRPEPAADLENTLKEKTDENSITLVDTAKNGGAEAINTTKTDKDNPKHFVRQSDPQAKYAGWRDDARLLDQALAELDKKYYAGTLTTEQKKWTNKLVNIDRQHFAEYVFYQGIQTFAHQQQVMLNAQQGATLTWLNNLAQREQSAVWLTLDNANIEPELTYIHSKSRFNNVAINGLKVEGKHKLAARLSNQQHNYEERYKAVTKSLKERFTELQLRYGYALSPQVELFGAVNYGKGKLKYQSSFNAERNNNEGRTTGYGANVGMVWRYPITANLSWQNMVDLAYGYKELSHLTTSNDVQISKLKTQFSSLGAVSLLNYQFGNINLFAHTRVQKTLSSKTKGEVNYVGVQTKVDQRNKIYPKTQVQFGAGVSYQHQGWKISTSFNTGNYHQRGINVEIGYTF